MKKKILILSILSMFMITGASVVSVADSENMILEDVETKNSPEIADYVVNDNRPPNPPVITGPTTGKPGVEYEYEIYMEDPDGDKIWEVEVDFGDGEIIWLPPPEPGWPSGSTEKVTHSWDEPGTYTMRARVMDKPGAWSDWGYLDVTMPKNQNQNQNKIQSLNNLILKILEQFTILKNLSLKL